MSPAAVAAAAVRPSRRPVLGAAWPRRLPASWSTLAAPLAPRSRCVPGWGGSGQGSSHMVGSVSCS